MGMYGVPRLTVTCGPGRAKQSMKDEVDVNRIVARYARTGQLSWVNTKQAPQFLDVSEVSSYRDAIEYVTDVRKWFSHMSAKVRARFNNDAAQFLDFMSDASNEAEAKELGLVAEPKAPEVPVDEVPGPGIQGRGPDGRFTAPGSPASGA